MDVSPAETVFGLQSYPSVITIVPFITWTMVIPEWTIAAGSSLFGCHNSGTLFAIEVSSSVHRTEQGIRISLAIRAARERATDEFRSSLSHALRTPMNVILGFAQLLQEDGKEPLSPRHRDWVARILRSSEQLLRLIEDVVDAPRPP